jgi:roadblock/LC7 domain-containing protein
MMRKTFMLSSVLLFIMTLATYTWAQSTISGDILGTVTDPSGAVVPGVTVTATSRDTGRALTATTNSTGGYRFALLPPGYYTLNFSSSNFQKATRTANVAVGQASTVNVQMAVETAGQTVTVTAEGNALQTENGNVSTTFSQEQISSTPNPGNDLTWYAQTSPGAVMNTQSGYGNVSTFGLPGTSNLFTVNGNPDNDPFFNLNNTGATNLMLGANDIREATVVNNGYSGEYGGLAGANVNYVTKSGTNNWHGNAQYFYNSDWFNANSWFNNNSGAPRTFALAQQWAGSVGGPIKKDKSFIFIDQEGLYITLPTSSPVFVPSASEQASILSGIPTSQLPFYNQIFSLYNHAYNANPASHIATGDPLTNEFRSTAGNHTHEWMLMGRYDQNIGNNDRFFFHVRTDQGVQATYTDPLTPVFNFSSNQPQWEGQLNETHTFGPNTVNQFILGGLYYRAIFNLSNPSAGLSLSTGFPYSFYFTSATSAGVGSWYPINELGYDLDGRNVTQYSIIDDVSHVKGHHALKFGVSFVRDDITDYDVGQLAQTGQGFATIGTFATGAADTYTQQFPTNGRISAPVRNYGLGLYAQDEWQARRNLKLTLAIRADHNSNPVCVINCFGRLPNSFASVVPPVSQPYNQAILFNQRQALTQFDKINWQPRFGFAYTPFGIDSNLVIRGGFGIFIDKLAGLVADDMLKNPPFNPGFTVASTPLSGVQSAAAAANTAFQSGFASGATVGSLANVPGFAPPTFFNPAGSLHSPQYQEWNLEIQKAFGAKTSFSINYVGNHGIHEPWVSLGENGYDVNGFGGLPRPSACPGPSGTVVNGGPSCLFGYVQQVNGDAVSNYNGVTVSLSRRLSSLQFQFNYTWSHALDEVSNGGFLPFSLGPSFSDNTSIITSQNPLNLGQFNHGNAEAA